MKAIWKGQIIAESEETVVVEGNHYFPAGSVKAEFLRESTHQSRCIWKGTASYYHVKVDEDMNANAAWYYPSPSDEAKHIEGMVAFWKGIQVEE